MIDIKYVKGDATVPQVEDGVRVITHVCNDIGGWGSGFVLAISKRWALPEQMYRSVSPRHLRQGLVQLVPVRSGLIVANMVAQNGTVSSMNPTPVNYVSIDSSLEQVAAYLENIPNSSVHMPRMGCDRAGGEWRIVEGIIIEQLSNRNIPVYVYDFE